MEIGQNIGHTREEQEEDLLELLYSWWKEGKELTIPEVSKEGELTRREVKSLLKEMTQKGYLEPGKKPEEIRLSDLGKSQGAECLSRHRNLTEFLQLICGLEEREAEEDGKRILLLSGAGGAGDWKGGKLFLPSAKGERIQGKALVQRKCRLGTGRCYRTGIQNPGQGSCFYCKSGRPGDRGRGNPVFWRQKTGS